MSDTSIEEFFKDRMEINHDTTDTNEGVNALVETQPLPTMEEHCNTPTATREDVDAAIEYFESKTVELGGKKITVTTARLWNGFTITETATCVSDERYSQHIGENICIPKIRDKVRFLLGYELQSKLAGEVTKAKCEETIIRLRSLLESAKGQDSLSEVEIDSALGEIKEALGSSDNYQGHVEIEARVLDDKISSLEFFMTSTKFGDLQVHEQDRLRVQRRAMHSYLAILNSRIANFTKED